jgi:hypothetical protein
MKSLSPLEQILPSLRLQPSTWLSNIITLASPLAVVQLSRVPPSWIAVRVAMYTSLARLPFGLSASNRLVGGAWKGGSVRGTAKMPGCPSPSESTPLICLADDGHGAFGSASVSPTKLTTGCISMVAPTPKPESVP